MDDLIISACKGKTASKGGLNVKELYRLAVLKGYNSNDYSRDALIRFLCGSSMSEHILHISKIKKNDHSTKK